MGHDENDGIQELDNPLPGWWLVTFYGTIIFAFFYWIHYTFTNAPDLQGELKLAMDELERVRKNSGGDAGGGGSGGALPAESEEQLAALFAPGDRADQGKVVFAAKCASCHGPEGAGLVGPNLTDKFWIHGKGTRKDILAVISGGVKDKGMPAWSEMLSKEELYSSAAFVFSIKGKNLPGKPPEGNEVP
ncbi:MAG: nitrogen fixation protein FixP [Bdellovibrio sp.]|nr:MAG: nitrogen fixation protein FixP [Bdellovibrio sp.]